MNARLQEREEVLPPGQHGGLLFKSLINSKLLQDAIGNVVGGRHAAQSIPVRGYSDRRPQIARVMRLDRHPGDVFGPSAVLLILMHVGARAVPDDGLLNLLFDLTPAEARLLQALAGGLRLAELRRERRRPDKHRPHPAYLHLQQDRDQAASGSTQHRRVALNVQRADGAVLGCGVSRRAASSRTAASACAVGNASKAPNRQVVSAPQAAAGRRVASRGCCARRPAMSPAVKASPAPTVSTAAAAKAGWLRGGNPGRNATAPRSPKVTARRSRPPSRRAAMAGGATRASAMASGAPRLRSAASTALTTRIARVSQDRRVDGAHRRGV